MVCILMPWEFSATLIFIIYNYMYAIPMLQKISQTGALGSRGQWLKIEKKHITGKMIIIPITRLLYQYREILGLSYNR